MTKPIDIITRAMKDIGAVAAVAAAGDVYYNSGTNKLRCYNGTTWNDLF